MRKLKIRQGGGFVLCLLFAVIAARADSNARNVILFLADGAGLPTVNAASLYAYGKPRALYVQNMPHIGLSDTSTASSWVADSAAGMTAIVTGRKTHNGVVSQSASAVRGQKDGEPLKTILEYAEEKGLATGVVSDSSMAGATPAACYGHANDRSKHGEIFLQILEPRFGDGVDVVIGYGRKDILEKTAALGVDLPAKLRQKGFTYLETPAALNDLELATGRVVALFDEAEFDLAAVSAHAIRILSRNPRGFFLMIESNTHGANPRRNLERMVAFDNIVRRAADARRHDTLIVFTADHSHDLRLHGGGQKGENILPFIRFDGGTHTAEEVLVAAEGPGADRARGFLPNTRIFEIMMNAYGWQPDRTSSRRTSCTRRVPLSARAGRFLEPASSKIGCHRKD